MSDAAPAPSRLGMIVNTGAFLAAVITIALVVCYFAYRPEGRATFDATKTRQLLESISDQPVEEIEDLS